MFRLVLSQINIYPVKSLAGLSVASAEVEARGLRHDRRWMLVDENARFLSQRELPRMATVSATVGANCLTLSAPGAKPLQVTIRSSGEAALTVRVWRSECQAALVGEDADRWFQEFLGTPCRLVSMPEQTRRQVNSDYRAGEGIVSFADGYPLMLLGEASLADLNARLQQSVPMNRFRPSLVVSGSLPYAEDGWTKIRIGAALFHGVKPCDRCVMTTIDQATGESDGVEPLKTLASYRLQDQKVLFGRFLIPDGGGIVHVGDAVEVL